MEVRLAIIGTFWLSETFLMAMDRTEGVRLAAVCSRSYDKAAKFAVGREGVKLYTDVQMVADDTEIDAVYIAQLYALRSFQKDVGGREARSLRKAHYGARVGIR